MLKKIVNTNPPLVNAAKTDRRTDRFPHHRWMNKKRGIFFILLSDLSEAALWGLGKRGGGSNSIESSKNPPALLLRMCVFRFFTPPLAPSEKRYSAHTLVSHFLCVPPSPLFPRQVVCTAEEEEIFSPVKWSPIPYPHLLSNAIERGIYNDLNKKGAFPGNQLRSPFRV